MRQSSSKTFVWNLTAKSRKLLAMLILSASISLLVKEWTSRSGPPLRPTLVVDPNTCPVEVLQALPRLGPVLASRIVTERELKPFRTVDELDARIRGIGPVTLAAIRPFLRIGPGHLTPDSPQRDSPQTASRRNLSP